MIRLAVIGVGRMGSRHALNIFKNIKGATLCALSDIDTNTLNEQCQKFQVKGYIDYKEMLLKEKLDGVVIATPHYSHADIAIDCLNAGVNILVEKPITVTTKEAKRLIKVANDSNLICSMMFNQRTNRMYQKARQLIKDGVIGDIQRVNFTITNWYRSQFYYNMGGWRASWKGEGGGTLINQCVHQLDILQWLLGMPKAIYSICKTKGREITTENDVTAILSYDTFECVFTASTHEYPGENRLVIAGSKGRIEIYPFKMKYVVTMLDEKEINARSKKDYGNKEDKKKKKYSYSYGLKNMIKDGLRGQQANIIENFTRAIQNKDKNILIAPLDEGIKAVTLINGLILSSWEDKKIDLPFNDDFYVEKLQEKIDLETSN